MKNGSQKLAAVVSSERIVKTEGEDDCGVAGGGRSQ